MGSYEGSACGCIASHAAKQPGLGMLAWTHADAHRPHGWQVKFVSHSNSSIWQLWDAHWLHVAGGPASIGGGPPSEGGGPPSTTPLHWAWHACNVPNPIWEHGVPAMQLATQSNCVPIIVEQSTPILLHVKPVHCAT
jgi:hypothetical protein